jgi:Flp pilus assembly protein TadD
MADRYTYFPQVGLSLILVQLCRQVFESKDAPRKVLLTAFAAVSLLLAVLSFNQVRTWRNMDALMDHALALTPGNAKVHFGKAIAYHNRGEEEKAMEHLVIAARLAPNYKQVQEEIEIVRESMRRKRRFGN